MAFWDFLRKNVHDDKPQYEPIGISVWNRKGRNGAGMIPSIYINELISLANKTWKNNDPLLGPCVPTGITYGIKALGRLKGWQEFYETPKLVILGDYSLKTTRYDSNVEIFVQAFPLNSMELKDSEIIWVYGEIANLLLYELAQAISTANDTPEDVHSAALDLLRLIPSSDSVITNRLLDKISNDLQDFKQIK
jgi:hypothetical protein